MDLGGKVGPCVVSGGVGVSGSVARDEGSLVDAAVCGHFVGDARKRRTRKPGGVAAELLGFGGVVIEGVGRLRHGCLGQHGEEHSGEGHGGHGRRSRQEEA